MTKGWAAMTEIPFFPIIKLDEAITSTLEQFFMQQYHRKASYKKNDLINIHFAEEITGFISKGRVKIYMCDDSGEERLMFLLEERSTIFTGMAAFMGKTVIAAEDTEILYVSMDCYYDFLLSSKHNLLCHLEIVNSRYGACIQQCLVAPHQSSRQKVYNFIYQIALKFGEKMSDGRTMIVNLPSRKHIASITGVHSNNVTSFITELKNQCLFEETSSKSTIIINDLSALQQLILQLE